MKREPGYYWVKVNPVNWRIYYYDGRVWLMSGMSVEFIDDFFLEIDERRIERL